MSSCWRDLLSVLEFPSGYPSWKLVGSLGLRLMIRFILSPRRPPAAAAAVAANVAVVRPPRRFTAPPPLGLGGLIDLLRSSSSHGGAPPPAPRLLLSPSVGRPPRPPRHYQHWGQVLIEIFSVHADFPFRGTIHLIDGRGSHTIYYKPPNFDPTQDYSSQRREWLTTHVDSSEFKYKLVLTGPQDGMFSLDAFTFQVAIAGVDEWHYQVSLGESDNPVDHDEVNTTTVGTCRGSLYFTYALVSDAVRADVYFHVRLPSREAVRVHGHIMAYIGTFEIGSTLFSKDADNAAFIGPQHVDDSGAVFRPPLDRACFAVPIGSYLHLKGELVIDGSHKVSVDHSIPVEGLNFRTAWVQDIYGSSTCVYVSFHEVWI